MTTKLVVLVLLSIALMTVDHRFHHLAALRSALTWLLYPVEYLVDLPFRTAAWLDESLTLHATLEEENARLRERQLLDDIRLQKLAALELENERLRELLHASEQLDQRVGIAELLAVDLDPYRQEVLINKGARDDVYLGQPLIDAHGIMGQIIRVESRTSTAMLISDPSHALPVQVNRTGLRTLAVGTGDPETLDLRHIPLSADIQVGDVVSTSGLGQRFPPDYPVGEVTKVERITGEHFATVEARPYARLDRSREVLLIWTANALPPPVSPAPPEQQEPQEPQEPGAEPPAAVSGAPGNG